MPNELKCLKYLFLKRPCFYYLILTFDYKFMFTKHKTINEETLFNRS